MGNHSRVGGSATKRFCNCTGSVALCATIPKQPSGPYADEGSAAHLVCEYCALNRIWNADEIRHDPYVVLSIEPDENRRERFRPYINDEMLDNVQIYLDNLRSQCTPDAFEVGIEKKVSLDWLHPELRGTVDSYVYAGNVLHLNDLKYGAGVQIDAEDNGQLKYYALGALGKKNPYKVERVVLTIVQPRGYHPDGPVRSWEISAEDLYLWGKTVLGPKAHEATGPNPVLNAGPWCKETFCPAQAVCPELASMILEAAKAEFDTPIQEISLTPPNQLDNTQLLKMAQLLEILEPYKLEVMNYIQSRMQVGDKSFNSFYKLVRKKTNRRIRPGAEKEMELEFGEGIYDRKLKGLGALEKLFGKNAVSGWTIKPEGEITIAPLSDKRQAVLSSDFDEWL